MSTHSPSAVRPAQPAPPLSAQLLAAAQTLGAQVNEGDFKGADPDAIFDLCSLSMMLATWSDRALTDEGYKAILEKSLHAYSDRQGRIDAMLPPRPAPAPTRSRRLLGLLGLG